MQTTKPNKLEDFIDRHTPDFIKKTCVKILSVLPKRTQGWISRNKMKTIYGLFIIKGLFLRPSMWALYAVIFGYFNS